MREGTQRAERRGAGYGTCIIVWAVMAVLTMAAAAAARAEGAGALKLLPVVIVVVKTFLILSFFMNLIYERGFIRLIILFALGEIVILSLFLFSDVGFR